MLEELKENMHMEVKEIQNDKENENKETRSSNGNDTGLWNFIILRK